jgi:hypothetical protein
VVQRTPKFPPWLLSIAAICLAAMAVAGCREAPPTKLASGLWLAVPGNFAGEVARLRIHHVESGFNREVGDAAAYRGLAWAPNGRYVAAVRANQQPAVVIFDLEDEDAAYEWPLETPETYLVWSPDGLRLFALSAAEGLMLNTEAEVIGFIAQPLEPNYPQSVNAAFWSPESEFVATIYHGYLMIVDRGGRNFFVDPASLPPMTGPTGLTVVGWDAEEVFAVFDTSDTESPRRFSFQVDGAELEYVATSNFPAGTGPYSPLFDLANAIAPESTIELGVASMPQTENWVAIQLDEAADTAIYHADEGSLYRVADPVFQDVPAYVVAANVALAVLPPLEDR